MSEYFRYYTIANVVCFIIFGIMFLHDKFSIDRQEKQILFDHTLISFMLYFISDTFFAAIISGVIPKTLTSVALVNFSNAVLMAVITYAWFRFALAVEQIPYRNNQAFMIVSALPLALSLVVAVFMYIIDPYLFFDEKLGLKPLYSVFQVGVPITYIIAELIYTTERASKEKNIATRRELILLGLFPLLVVFGGLFQVIFLPDTPVFCFCSTILMVVFYIQTMDSQISLDPLTQLNNRTQLYRYIAQDITMHREGRLTYIVMIDINDFKIINDTYGHSNGDKALVITADSLRKALGESTMPGFLGRFGGDEFIIIAHPVEEAEMQELEKSIRKCLHESCRLNNAPFDITVGIGYDLLDRNKGDTFERCMERADKKLYINKNEIKEKLKNTDRFDRSA